MFKIFILKHYVKLRLDHTITQRLKLLYFYSKPPQSRRCQRGFLYCFSTFGRGLQVENKDIVAVVFRSDFVSCGPNAETETKQNIKRFIQIERWEYQASTPNYHV